MKLSTLIAQLQEIHDEWGDRDVVAAYQRGYPLAGVVLGTTVGNRSDDEPVVAWIAVGGPPPGLSPFAPAGAFEVEP